MADRFYFHVSSGIEDDLPELQERIFPLLVGQAHFLEVSFANPKGSIVQTEWISVFIDCSKEVAKVLAGVIAKAIFDYYKSKFAKSKDDVREITLYGPDSHIYKKFTVVGHGPEVYITDEKEDYTFPPSDAFS